ncbi:MAG: Zn-ribbon domain-containing OB-fold protein [Thermodesulfobacteriota bacterium]
MKKCKEIVPGLFSLDPDRPGEGRLIGSRCRRCGLVSFPPRKVCPDCLGDDCLESVALGRRGTLYSFAVNQMAPEGFKAPYVTGKVDLPEKVRVFTVITGVEPEESALSIGQEMELVFGPMARNAAGEDLIGYMFRPASPSAAREE